MKRSEFIDGLEQSLFDNQLYDGHVMEEVMKYIEQHMKPEGFYTETHTEWGVSFNNLLYYNPGWEPENG